MKINYWCELGVHEKAVNDVSKKKYQMITVRRLKKETKIRLKLMKSSNYYQKNLRDSTSNWS